MGTQWTKEQREAISLHDRDILVSAAAGSGKTAVLVERIVQMVTREENPVDIDHLLVVTFTRAAAGEMKERILTALDARLADDPENEHLQRQVSYIHNAQINTIDGFCSYVIRNYFYRIDLDPASRTADEGELKLMKREVVQEVLEEAYAGEEKDFLCFVECCATGRSDTVLEDLILDLYEESQSHPWPDEWLASCLEVYELSAEELMRTDWMEELSADADRRIAECICRSRQALALCDEPDGPHMYRRALESDLDFLGTLAAAKTYQERQERFAGLKWARLSSKKSPDVSEELKGRVKSIREQVRKQINHLAETSYRLSQEEIAATMANCRPATAGLVEVTRKFASAFARKKRQKNVLDFSDMEHFALEILVEHGPDRDRRTQAARELSARFEEILIDEYQDSNYVQELILGSVSRRAQGVRNVFMVGDAKQSIYRFRLANPKLFMDKYHTYDRRDGPCRRIDLSRNFRSRTEVLDFVNLIFSHLMTRPLGGVDYDEHAALYPGAVYPLSGVCETEVLMIERDTAGVRETIPKDAERELEARMIGGRIRVIVGQMPVWDSQAGQYRPARYADCVILLRSVSGFGEAYAHILQSMGIPAHVTAQTGYFSAVEVTTLLHYLRILDNPRQDIPFAAVLHSPIAGLGDEELAMLRLVCPEGCLYEGARLCRGETEIPGVREKTVERCGGEEADDDRNQDAKYRRMRDKLRNFFEGYDEIREQVAGIPVHRLIQLILERTGYGSYVRAMPAGEQRYANVLMLQEKALAFEQTGDHGLFSFLYEIEQLQKYEIDFGEVNLTGENADTVRIMTIHKSKGLEFPIVFLAGMGKKFNMRDLNGAVIVHPDLGLAIDSVDPERRIRVQTLFRTTLRMRLLRENLSEELRVLYVALTRAKEKLILAGTIDRLEKRLEQCEEAAGWKDGTLPMSMVEGARDYWSWVLPALAAEGVSLETLVRMKDPQAVQGQGTPGLSARAGGAKVTVKKLSLEDLVFEEVHTAYSRKGSRDRLENWDPETVYDPACREEIDERFSFVYPYERQKEVPVKVTVTELKDRHGDEEVSEELYFEPDMIPLVPAFIQETKTQTPGGADRGTAYHRVFALLDYAHTENAADVRRQLEQMVQTGKIAEHACACVDPDDFAVFCGSGIGERMRQAAADHRLYREQPFTMSIPASEMDSRYDDCDSILVQGMIDAFFFENDGIVLVDYKTDRIRRKEELVRKYQKQIDYYAQALERTTGRKVTERYLYSVTLGCAIGC